MHPSTLDGSHARYYFGPSRLLTKPIHLRSQDGTLDFTITGGNGVQPIQVASVVWASQAYSQGMRPGDEIISVNGIPFDANLSYAKAVGILYSSSQLDILIRTLRVSALDATLYDWFNPVQQRATSPPPGNYLSFDAQLPYFERTVTLRVEPGKRLGLVIRGGAEYGLGIFISGVDRGSLSEQAGLHAGDQLLSVNETDFRHITHSDAVHLLRTLSTMVIHIRQINKLPKPKQQTNRMISPRTSPRAFPPRHLPIVPPLPLLYNSSRPFPTHSLNSKDKEESLIDEILRDVSNNEQRYQLSTYIRQYLDKKMPVDDMIRPVLQMLNREDDQLKNRVIPLVRELVRRHDLDRFDIYLLKDDLQTLKVSHERLLHHSLSSSRMSLTSPFISAMSKSVENLTLGSSPHHDDHILTNVGKPRLTRPQSLIFDEKNVIRPVSPPVETSFSLDRQVRPVTSLPLQNNAPLNPMRKAKSLHNVNQQRKPSISQLLPIRKSRSNLTIAENDIIETFLKDYSAPYPITIHKIRPTLGVAIEGGFQDRVPLPRVVYMQPDGSAYVSSGLRVGHVILGLNGYLMKGLFHREAALFIASAFKDKNTSRMDLTVAEPLIVADS